MRVAISLAAFVASIAMALTMMLARAEVATTICMDPATRERAREIIIDGIEQGLKQHTVHVYDVWLKDPSDQPKRARQGMNIGVNAYNRARNAALVWMPPTCQEPP
jgi:hypothetical protein